METESAKKAKRKRDFKDDVIGKRRFELFMRDPLKNETELLFRKSHLDNISEDEKASISNRVENLFMEMMKKWNCNFIPNFREKDIPDIIKTTDCLEFVKYLDANYAPSKKPSCCYFFTSGAFTVGDATEHIRKLMTQIKRDFERHRSQELNHFERTGWIFYYLDGGYDDRGNVYIPIPPISVPIIVDIGGLTEKDKNKVTEEIWNIIKAKIRERRNIVKRQWKGIPFVRDSKELGFISVIEDDKDFAKYLKWYDLHMGGEHDTPKGLHFRTIAYHEFLEREHPDKAEEAKKRIAERTKTIKSRIGKERTIKGFIGTPIKGEDNVEKQVKLIYQAIYRKAYPSKKKMELFNCPEHGDKCPKECTFLKIKMKDFNKKSMLFKPLVTTEKELSVIDSEKEFEKAEERIDLYFKNKKRIK